MPSLLTTFCWARPSCSKEAPTTSWKIAWVSRERRGTSAIEEDSLRFRCYIYVTMDLEERQTASPDNVRVVPPGYVLPPRYLDLVLGRPVRRAVVRGTALI